MINQFSPACLCCGLQIRDHFTLVIFVNSPLLPTIKCLLDIFCSPAGDRWQFAWGAFCQVDFWVIHNQGYTHFFKSGLPSLHQKKRRRKRITKKNWNVRIFVWISFRLRQVQRGLQHKSKKCTLRPNKG